MDAKQLSRGTETSWCIVFATGDDPVEGLLRFAREHELHGAYFTAIGAFSGVTLGYFDWERKQYEQIPVAAQVEVVSLVGNVARTEEGEPKVHAHVVVARRDGTALGGHLLHARVRPTLEVVITETPAHLRRVHDPETGLALIRPSSRAAG